jgi:hypothetical protein
MRKLAFVALLLAGPATAQVLAPREPKWTDKWNFGIGLFGAIPQGEFRNHENGGGGLDLSLGFQPFRRQPLSIRGYMAFMDYGGLRATGQQDVCDTFGNCWTESVEFDARSHYMMNFQIGPEFMFTDGLWRPFAYALVGTTVFNSTQVFQPTGQSGPEPQSESIFSSNNLSTSYGLGIRRVGTRWGRETGFELSTRFTRNAKATYLTERDLEQEQDGTWVIHPRHGAANVLGFQLGFWLGPYINWNERR